MKLSKLLLSITISIATSLSTNCMEKVIIDPKVQKLKNIGAMARLYDVDRARAQVDKQIQAPARVLCLFDIPREVMPNILFYVFQTPQDFTDNPRYFPGMPALGWMPMVGGNNGWGIIEVRQSYCMMRLTCQFLRNHIDALENVVGFQQKYLRRLVRKSVHSQYVSELAVSPFPQRIVQVLPPPPLGTVNVVPPLTPANLPAAPQFPENMFLHHFGLITLDGQENLEGIQRFKKNHGSFFKAWASKRFEFIFDQAYYGAQVQILCLPQNTTNHSLAGFPLKVIPIVPSLPPFLINFDQPAALGNMLVSFPTQLLTLKYLCILGLNANQLESIPPEIGELTSLRSLQLCQNHIRILPDEIGKLVNLENLELSWNQLTTLPASLGNCKNLGRFKLPNPAQPAQPGLHYTFDLSNNCLRSIPKELGKLTSVDKLCLSFNELEELPDEMVGMKSLKVLDLANNRFLELPKVIGLLAGSLQRVDLSCNPFNYYPLETWTKLNASGKPGPFAGDREWNNSMIVVALEAKPIWLEATPGMSIKAKGSKVVFERLQLPHHAPAPGAVNFKCHFCQSYGN
jgi:hypothetical protein